MAKQVQSKIHNKSKVFGYPDALRLRGSVVTRIALPVSILTAWAVVVYLLFAYVPESRAYIAFDTLFIQIISLVLSLLLVFRTNTAYDRYWEGRRLWGQLIKDCRNLARFIWVGVNEETDQAQSEKKAAVKLILAYFISVKNHLRFERGIEDPATGQFRADIINLIPVKKQQQLADLEDLRSVGSDKAQPKADIVIQMYGAFASDASPNLPVDISHLISAYIASQRKADNIDIPQYSAMVATVSSMIEVLSNLERILTSPIPIAYNTHLKQALYIYLILLPFQLVTKLNFWSVLLTFLASFTLLGVESIGAEIENPFGTDSNDLPLERFCEDMTTELRTLMKKPRMDLADWEMTALANRSATDVSQPQEQFKNLNLPALPVIPVAPEATMTAVDTIKETAVDILSED